MPREESSVPRLPPSLPLRRRCLPACLPRPAGRPAGGHTGELVSPTTPAGSAYASPTWAGKGRVAASGTGGGKAVLVFRGFRVRIGLHTGEPQLQSSMRARPNMAPGLGAKKRVARRRRRFAPRGVLGRRPVRRHRSSVRSLWWHSRLTLRFACMCLCPSACRGTFTHTPLLHTHGQAP